jgi:hypothetical protein
MSVDDQASNRQSHQAGSPSRKIVRSVVGFLGKGAFGVTLKT